MLESLEYLFEQPQVTGDLRSSKADFKVFELLPFTASGEGEHLLIKIRKSGLNTVDVARQLASYFKVKENLVSYAGLKDRFAITEQWFGVHLPGKQSYTLNDFTYDGVEVLAVERHHKKLRIGALLGNRFEICLRNISDVNELKRRWHAICQFGVPNYFGEQRFGINGANVDRAKEMFAGKKCKNRNKRSIYLSAARSYLFNQMIDRRLKNGTFETIDIGDVLMLAGTQSVFVVDDIDQQLQSRLQEQDLDITAPLWGSGALMSKGEALIQELALKDDFPELCSGLVKFGLKQERRKIRLCISEPKLTLNDDSCVTVSFNLPSKSLFNEPTFCSASSRNFFMLFCCMKI